MSRHSFTPQQKIAIKGLTVLVNVLLAYLKKHNLPTTLVINNVSFDANLLSHTSFIAGRKKQQQDNMYTNVLLHSTYGPMQ